MESPGLHLVGLWQLSEKIKLTGTDSIQNEIGHIWLLKSINFDLHSQIHSHSQIL